ncbi:SURF1 family protein [Ramlibacter henchirensis]|uniref:SURF1-like protein n=1 Tax=Ramlibacter henchirensis TaxID=204072 RepID=A0A4Z0C563_9BURK|nr:SURF1 family protein [Ramlibacter henchirensis]TFZ06431.1 SURF1 family protein [Ramlibacter henchirensis]
MTGWRFWAATLAAVLGIGATFALGMWQLGRAHQKEALADAVSTQKRLTPLSQAEFLSGERHSAVYRPVLLRGRWVAEHTVFLDNRQMGGKVGFYVVTPLKLSGSDAAVLVQRGWAPRNFVQREQLPVIETPAGEVEVTGRIAPPPAKLYEFGPAGAGPIRQNLDLTPFAAETRLKLLQDVSVQQTGPASQGLQRDWPEAGAGRGPETNYGYAFQWWALCGLIAILYVWFQFIQPRRQARQV